MLGSSVLEVIIGVVFVFLLVSLLVTAANELLANLLQSRSKFLWKGVSAMLEPGNPGAGAVSGLVKRLFQHPLISGMSPGGGQRQRKPGPPLKTPSYLPSGAFSIALLDLLGVTRATGGEWPQKLQARLAALPASGGSVDQVRQAMESIAGELGAALDGAQLKTDLGLVASGLTQNQGDVSRQRDRLTLINAGISGALSWLKQPMDDLIQSPTPAALAALIAQVPSAGPDGAALAGRLTEWLNKGPAATTDYSAALQTAQALAAESSASNVRRALENLPASDMQQILLNLFDEAEGDYTKFKANVESWYDMIMDRVSGWYKRRTAWVTLVLGAIIAVTINVDAVLIMRRLSVDPALRQALVADSRSFAANPPVPVEAALPVTDPSPSSNPGMTALDRLPAPRAAAPFSDPVASYNFVYQRLDGLSLPIGWSTAPGVPASNDPAVAERRVRPDFRALLGLEKTAWDQLGQTVLFHLVGWLLTAVSASLGAPFWFDLLGKLMNIRQAGARPKKKKDAAK